MHLTDHLEKLIPFKAIADAGALNQAARILRVSQSSLSKTVQILEDVVGQPLFLRGHRGVRLTEAGTVLYGFAAALAKDSEAVVGRIRSPESLPSGEVRLAMYPPLAAAVYPRIVARLARENPRLRVSLRTHASTSVLLAWLSAGEIDVAVALAERRTSALISVPFATCVFGFYTNASSPCPAALTEEQLRAYPLVHMDETFAGGGRSLRDLLIERGLYDGSLCVDSHEVARSFAFQSECLAVLPNILAEAYVTRGILRQVRIDAPWAERLGEHHLAALAKSDQAEQRAVSYILQRLRGGPVPPPSAPHPDGDTKIPS